MAESVDVDLHDLPQAVQAMSRDPDEAALRAYNPVGYALVSLPVGSAYAQYAVRVSDLEGTRRAALLAVELRAGDQTTDLPERVRRSAQKNPYSNEPFEWDAETRSIVFSGLALGARGRNALLL